MPLKVDTELVIDEAWRCGWKGENGEHSSGISETGRGEGWLRDPTIIGRISHSLLERLLGLYLMDELNNKSDVLWKRILSVSLEVKTGYL